MSNTDPAVIEATGLTKRYGSRVLAVDGVDLTVRRGEIFGFLGPNGAGKTTTIRLITGFIRPSSGTVRVFGNDSWRKRVAVARSTGYLPDVKGLDDGRTGEGYLDYLDSLRGQPATLRASLIERLSFTHEALRRRIKTYSQGMRQKLLLIQALEHDPSLVILDEPTSSLDPLVQRALFEILEELRAKGTTIFMSSHVLSEVERLCDRVGIVRAGRLIATERIESLRQRRLRHVDVTFSGPAPVDGLRLPGVLNVDTSEHTWHLTYRGEINILLRELATHDLTDLTIDQPNLEEAFLAFYRPTSEPEVGAT